MKSKQKRGAPTGFVVVNSKAYGSKLKGAKIYYEGRRPRQLQNDGRIKFGKHVLEMLGRQFDRKFRWIITNDKDEIT